MAANPTGWWGAFTGSLALCVTVIIARRGRARLTIDSVGAYLYWPGIHLKEDRDRFDIIEALIVNGPGPTCTITRYDLEIYEGIQSWLRFRPTRVIPGNAYWPINPNGRRPGPISIKTGESETIDLYAPAVWPDKARRIVYFTARYTGSKRVLRKSVRPVFPRSYSDKATRDMIYADIIKKGKGHSVNVTNYPS
jgi:hypothetical protein